MIQTSNTLQKEAYESPEGQERPLKAKGDIYKVS